MFCKDKKWKAENEIRVIYDKTEKSKRHKEYWKFEDDGKIFLNATVKKVYLGCVSDTDSQYDEILQYLSENNIKFDKMKTSNKNYWIMIDRDFEK